MASPLVTVICLCYNHGRFVREAIQSVLDQTYQYIQLVVVDDASTDDSVNTIRDILENYPAITFLSLKQNLGNCAAFNRGLALASGDFVIDFATDDVMMPNKVQQQVEYFADLDRSYGVVFTDALYIDAYGEPLRKHYEYLFRRGLLKSIPQGDVYRDVLSTYFIASPTMMIRREVLEKLNGYDENLSYEDFDFWVRASRTYKFGFLNEVTTRIRINKNSMSTGWYRQGDEQLYSTYLVCRKAVALNRSEPDKRALEKRLRFEIRQSVFTENREHAKLFYGLLTEIGSKNFLTDSFILLNKLKLPLSFLRNIYHKIRYGK